MGNTLSSSSQLASSIVKETAPIPTVEPTQACPVDHSKMELPKETDGKCPVDHQKYSEGVSMKDLRKYNMSSCPMHADNQSQQPSGESCGSTSPHHQLGMNFGSQHAGGHVHFEIDPSNMEGPPNQMPAKDQPFPLDTTRQVSSIPRYLSDNPDNHWVYPSQQMFWNAMKRKGMPKEEENELSANEMSHIISIHNVNNEDTWNEVMKWEMLHYKECQNPRLKKFEGQPTKITPKARFRSLFLGYELPFDRHDWYVDRCGKEVHYVIDYYDSGTLDEETHRFAVADVRPALDSVQNALDRMYVAWWRWTTKD